MRHAITLLALSGILLSTAASVPAQVPEMFVTSKRCLACHNGLVTPTGEDVSIGVGWRPSMMANAARDPYWQAAVRREMLVHPMASAVIQNECSACHMPMARYQANAEGHQGEVFAHLPIARGASERDRLAADGVSCALCHQIGKEKLGEHESFTAGFVVDRTTPPGERKAFGPYDVDAGRQTLMRSASRLVPEKAAHVQSSELCATCHTLFTHALDAKGEVVGELAEQVPYLEWRHSDYRDKKSCQDCHMPEVEGETKIASVVGLLHEKMSRHVFRGGNILMPRILSRHATELGVVALPQELQTTVEQTTKNLQTAAARLAVEAAGAADGRLEAQVVVSNLAGHKLPSAYPSRRVWLHVTVRDASGKPVFESGRFRPDGSIAGNDNDIDATRFEPHYEVIHNADQVQIYEPILAEPGGAVTTVLLSASRYAKDNRLLPNGFDKATADEAVAVNGQAKVDADFTAGGDRVSYAIDVGGAEGPFTVEAELWYQPVGYRWAHNLSDQQAPEIERFVGYYEEMAGVSGTVLARVQAVAQ
jgi:hypothetical protein